MKLLFFFPAFLYGAFLALIGFGVGFGAFEAVAWVYAALLFVAGILLTMKQWWGAIPGMAVGGIIIYVFTHSHVHHHINETPIGIVVIAYFLAMGFICYKRNRK
nr:hypothetical protein [Oscillospiraceae bacterium]